jgi:putative transposase
MRGTTAPIADAGTDVASAEQTSSTDTSLSFGERHLRYLVKQFVEHYLTERYHQGIGGRIIKPRTSPSNDNGTSRPIGCRSRLGGLLNYCHREAA